MNKILGKIKDLKFFWKTIIIIIIIVLVAISIIFLKKDIKSENTKTAKKNNKIEEKEMKEKNIEEQILNEDTNNNSDQNNITNEIVEKENETTTNNNINDNNDNSNQSINNIIYDSIVSYLKNQTNLAISLSICTDEINNTKQKINLNNSEIDNFLNNLNTSQYILTNEGIGGICMNGLTISYLNNNNYYELSGLFSSNFSYFVGHTTDFNLLTSTFDNFGGDPMLKIILTNNAINYVNTIIK